MAIRIQSIKFNHIPGSMKTDAMTIRKNKTQQVNIPEWSDGISIKPEDSPAAYAIAETRGNTLTIQARFLNSQPGSSSAEVRAVPYGNPLGEVKPQRVVFNNGDSGYVTMPLANTTIGSAGVAVYAVSWQWQCRVNGGVWQNMQLTRHKIYIVLAAAPAPWSQQAGSDQLPWTDVLDYSCSWAAGAKTPDEVYARITANVNALGRSIITYNCPGNGDRCYATYFNTFNCTKFIQRLKGGVGNGPYVNCTDCATIVTTFANILGGQLWSSRMNGEGGGYNYFTLNPIVAIGSNVWSLPCGNWIGFSYHEVAWKDGCTQNDNLYDACLLVDGDANPQTAPHTPLLPVNIQFGNCTTLNYRLRLCPPGTPGCNTCIAKPGTRVRRSVY